MACSPRALASQRSLKVCPGRSSRDPRMVVWHSCTAPTRRCTCASGCGPCSKTMLRGERNIQWLYCSASSCASGTLQVTCTCSTTPISPASMACIIRTKAGWKTWLWLTPRAKRFSAASATSSRPSSAESTIGFSTKTPIESSRSSRVSSRCRSGGVTRCATCTRYFLLESCESFATAYCTPHFSASARARSITGSQIATTSTCSSLARISMWKSAMKPAPTRATRVGPSGRNS